MDTAAQMPRASTPLSYTAIEITLENPVVPFCADASGKRRKMGYIFHREMSSLTSVIENTPQQFYIGPNEWLECVLTEDNQFVRAVNRIQVRSNRLCALDNTTMNGLLHDGQLRFFRNGMLAGNVSESRCFTSMFSDHGNNYVYCSHDVAIDAEGYVKTLTDSDHPLSGWANTYHPYSVAPNQYLFAMPGFAAITQDRKAWFKGNFIEGIPDPVIDIALSQAGLWALTVKGEVYLAKVKHEVFYSDAPHDNKAFLMEKNATAISCGYYSRYFVYADDSGALHVYDCRDCQLKQGKDGEYRLYRDYPKVELYEPKVFQIGPRRISELCVYDSEIGCSYANGGHNFYSATTGKESRCRW